MIEKEQTLMTSVPEDEARDKWSGFAHTVELLVSSAVARDEADQNGARRGTASLVYAQAWRDLAHTVETKVAANVARNDPDLRSAADSGRDLKIVRVGNVSGRASLPPPRNILRGHRWAAALAASLALAILVSAAISIRLAAVRETQMSAMTAMQPSRHVPDLRVSPAPDVEPLPQPATEVTTRQPPLSHQESRIGSLDLDVDAACNRVRRQENGFVIWPGCSTNKLKEEAYSRVPRALSINTCINACALDARCKAFEFDANECSLFDDVTAISGIGGTAAAKQ